MLKIRLTNKELNIIMSLIAEGKSLNNIVSLTGKSKTTIYYHFKKIKGRTVKPVCICSKNEESIGEFLGVFAGDGGFYKTPNGNYKIYLTFNIKEDKYVADLIKELLLPLFDKKPMRFIRENRIILVYYSKNIYDFITQYLIWQQNTRKTHTIQLKCQKHTNSFIIGFLRGSLDSDGYFSDKKILFATSSEGLAKDILFFLDKLKIVYHHSFYVEKRKNRVGMHHINIRQNERNKFLFLINPRERKNIKKYASAETVDQKVVPC